VSGFFAWAGTSAGLAIVAGIGIVCGWLALRVLRIRRGTSEADLVVALTLVMILVFTLRPGNVAQLTTRWQLLPFADLVYALPRGGTAVRLALADLAGNVVLFVPLGGALALRWPGLGEGRAVLGAVALSIVIEVIQGLTATGRMAQLTDVLMNALGAWIGWLVISRLRRSGVVTALVAGFSDGGRRRR